MRFVRRGAAVAAAFILLLAGASQARAGDQSGAAGAAPSRTAASGAGASGLLTPEQAVEEALRSNPEVESALHAWRAAEHVPRQVSGLDDPEVSYESWNSPNAFTFDRAENNIYAVSQRIPFPGKLGLRGKSARIAADATGQSYAQKRLEIAAKVKSAYADLYQAERSLEILARARELAGTVVEAARARYEAGEGSQAEVLKAQLARSQADREINQLEEARLAAQARLNALLDRPQGTATRTVADLPLAPLPPDVDDLERRAAAARPAVKAAALQVDRADTDRRLARMRYLPDFEIRGSRFVNRGEDNGYGAMLMVNIPWVWRGKHDAAIAEALERRREAAAALRARRNETALGVRELHARAERALRNAELLRTALLPQARLAFDATLAGYETGEETFPGVLESYQARLYLETQRVEEVATYQRAVAALEEMTGGVTP
jgi:outer membrane protein TolC